MEELMRALAAARGEQQGRRPSLTEEQQITRLREYWELLHGRDAVVTAESPNGHSLSTGMIVRHLLPAADSAALELASQPHLLVELVPVIYARDRITGEDPEFYLPAAAEVYNCVLVVCQVRENGEESMTRRLSNLRFWWPMETPEA